MFGKRFHLMTVSGISIGFDVSWLFIAVLLTWTLGVGYFPHYYPGLEETTYFLMGLLGMLGLFVSIVLHELGHAITAQQFHLQISQITLFLFGGVAELRSSPPSPKVEFLVAIAGPIVSVLLAAAFQLLAAVGTAQGWETPVIAVLSYLALINTIVVLFNLIPAFPLDGGRMLRALLWAAKGRLGWATRISTRIGFSFGFALIFFGLLILISGNFIAGLWWMIIGLFLQQAAQSSQTRYFVRRELRGEKVKKYMIRDPLTVPSDITIQDFVDNHVYHSYHHLYPVLTNGELEGYVTLEQIKKIEKSKWPKTLIKDALVPLSKTRTVTPESDVFEVFTSFREAPTESLLVTKNGQLQGLLGANDLAKIISLKLELENDRF